MTMVSRQKTITEYEISCDGEGCDLEYTYISTSMINGFVEIRQDNGRILHYCPFCCDKAIDQLRDSGVIFEIFGLYD